MVYSVVCKGLPATNSQGLRVKASYDGKFTIIPWDYSKSFEENMDSGFQAISKKMKFSPGTKVVKGQVKDGEVIYTPLNIDTNGIIANSNWVQF